MRIGDILRVFRACLGCSLAAVLAGSAAAPYRRAAAPSFPSTSPTCDPDNAGLALPAGFCAVLVAQGLDAPRHLAVAPNGDVFVALYGRAGGVLALRDTDGDGRADRRELTPVGGGNGIALTADHLYFATDAAILRWGWSPGQLKPAGEPEQVVRDLPTHGNHTSKSVAVGPDGSIYVNVGSATNSCQRADRRPLSPGIDPCSELNTRAGIWRFAPDRLQQTQGDGTHYATGLRNTIALAFDPASGLLYGATHGRDQLGDNWGFSDRDNAEKPAEEFGQIREGSDFGWPYCFYDPLARKKVLAPEYGGDGVRIGRCASKQDPLIGFPGHWGPMAIAFYHGTQFPAPYAGGAFIAFHGSWNRAPLRQAGFRVVFAPFKGGKPTGTWETFATLAGQPTDFRPSGLAIGPDGSLYISADENGKVWRVMKQ